MVRKILYSEKLLGERTFANFVVLWLFTKVFSAKFGGVHLLPWPNKSNVKDFSLESFPLYSILHSLAERKEPVANLECYLS